MNNVHLKQVADIHQQYRKRNMKSFWNLLKKHQRSIVHSALQPDDFASYYAKVMSDDESNLNPSQQMIKDFVAEKKMSLQDSLETIQLTTAEVRKLIVSMKRGICPGHDRISTEHLFYGATDTLCGVLADLYSSIMSTTLIPESLSLGVVIPILKKASLDPNGTENYRPITLSSTYSRLLELLIAPEYTPCDTQYGFRAGRGTSFVTSLINDVTSYFNAAGSPVYLCTLDAEKCFDSIWHSGLFYKLWGNISPQYWALLLNMYQSSEATVKWENRTSKVFNISRGMKQGSLVSPTLFNVFIDDLLHDLKNTDCGIRVDDLLLNSCTYADDVTLFCSTIPGLQRLMNISASYAKQWRFSFSTRKTKCIVLGKQVTKEAPKFYLKDHLIPIADQVDILGTTFTSDNKNAVHINNRISACRRSIYGLSSVGMSYPGLSSEVKAYIWKTVGVPTLTYGMDSLALSLKDCQMLSSTATNAVKSVLGIRKRSHHSKVLEALNIPTIQTEVQHSTCSLYYRIFTEDSPTRELQTRLLSRFVTSGSKVNGTLLSNLVDSGFNPLNIICVKPIKNKYSAKGRDGVVDSLKYLLCHENYIKPWSHEFILTSLLTKAF